MPNTTPPLLRRKREMPANTLTKPKIGKNYGSDAYSSAVRQPVGPAPAASNTPAPAAPPAPAATPAATALPASRNVRPFKGGGVPRIDVPRIDVPDINSGRTFAMRDSALADRQDYSLAAAGAAGNSAMSPAGYGEFDEGGMMDVRDRAIGERRNQTVLQAQLQGDRDRLSLQAENQRMGDARDWARLALDNRESLREGDQYDRTQALAELESQHRQGNEDRNFGAGRTDANRNFALDKAQFGEQQLIADRPYLYKTQAEQETALRNEQDYGLKVDEAIAKTQWQDAQIGIQEQRYGDRPSDNGGQYLGVLNGAGVDINSMSDVEQGVFLDLVDQLSADPQYAGASKQEIAFAALDASGIQTPDAQYKAKGYVPPSEDSWLDGETSDATRYADVSQYNKARQAIPTRRQAPAVAPAAAATPVAPQDAAKAAAPAATDAKQAEVNKRWLLDPKNKQHPNYKDIYEAYFEEFGSPIEAPSYQRTKN